MGYTFEDVAIGRQLIAEIGRHQWKLGDLALKVVPYTGPFSGGEVLNKFADDIGLPPAQLGEYRRIAAAWPVIARVPGASYTLHRELAVQPDRIAVLRTYVRKCQGESKRPSLRGLQAYRGQKPTLEMTRGNLLEQIQQGLQEVPPNVRAQIIRDLLTDTATAHCYATIIAGSLPPPAPPGPRLPAWRLLARACDQFATQAGRILGEASQLPAGERGALTEARDRAASAVGRVGDYIHGGGSRGDDVDAELADLLRDAS